MDAIMMGKNKLILFACITWFGGLGGYGCQRTTPFQSKIKTKQALLSSENTHMKERESTNWQNGTEVFFILNNQEVVHVQKYIPEGFYIKGVIMNGEFEPKSGVLGTGELAKTGRYGWLELKSKEFYPMESDRKAFTPFVKGYITPQGFIPSLRDVFDEP